MTEAASLSVSADSAEKAYAEAAGARPEPVKAPVTAPVPSKSAPRAKVVKPAAEAAPVKAVKVRRASKPAVTKAPKVAKAPKIGRAKATRKVARPSSRIIASLPFAKIKDTIMSTKPKDFTKTIKAAFADVQAKAKVGYEKGAAAVGEATEFTKGNAGAVVASGKILADGLKDIGTTCVAEAKAVAATANADLKELAAVKTPVDFFKLQGEIAARNFEQALAFSSQSSEALLKVVGEAYAPISGRIGLAIEKVRKAA